MKIDALLLAAAANINPSEGVPMKNSDCIYWIRKIIKHKSEEAEELNRAESARRRRHGAGSAGGAVRSGRRRQASAA